MTTTHPLLDPRQALLDLVIPACAPWSHVLRPGQVMRLIDLEGCQALDALFYNATDPAERYSAQDTIRVNGTPYIGLGMALVSSEGQTMATLIADTCGNHDTLAGCCSCESNAVRFGEETRYQHACRENFVLELARRGLARRDIVPNVNFFMNVPIAPSGECTVVDGVSAPGSHVDLRAEMDLLCVFSNCPQINNPCNDFDPTRIRVLVWDRPAH
jgi:urea carboxylase-associated protein 1